MNLVVYPELPTASVVRRKRRPPPWATLHLTTRPESTYKSGKVVQTTGATSQRLNSAVPGFDVAGRPRSKYPADKWLLSSATQKLIRRGLAEQAVKTALALHALDPDYLPRRLPIIAFEDIGVGDLIACFDTLHVFRTQRFATETPEPERRQIIANLVYRLAGSVKSRSGCDIFCLANADQEYSKAAAKFARSSETCLAAMAADRGAALTSRALALHLLSGMTVQEGRWRRTVSRFNGKALGVVADRLELPEVIGWLMIEGRHTAGMAAMLPLVWEAVQSADLRIGHADLRVERPILGLPPYAADMYTRSGKGAIAEFSKVLRERYARFFKVLPETRILPKLIGMAIFHAEGSKLDRWLEHKTLTGFREQIERIELQALGLPDPDSHRTLYRMLDEERPLLRHLRLSHVQAAIAESARNV